MIDDFIQNCEQGVKIQWNGEDVDHMWCFPLIELNGTVLLEGLLHVAGTSTS